MAALLKSSLNVSNEPKAASMALANFSLGLLPFLGVSDKK